MFTNISAQKFILCLALLNLLLFNIPLALFTEANLEYANINGARTILTLVVIVLGVTVIILSLISLFSTTFLKVVAAALTLGNAVALYFILTYNVILDKSMMGNVFNTRTDDSLDFISPTSFFYAIVFGILPAFFILRTRVNPVRRLRSIAQIVFAFIAVLATIYVNGSTSLWFDRHAKTLGGLILPWSYVINSVRTHLEQWEDDAIVLELPKPTTMTAEKSVAILIIGETARSANFSLYGYERNTNPQLAKSDAIALQNSKACSSYTTASLHCILSYDGSTRGNFEPLPTYLNKHDVEVIWRTTTWGEQPIEVNQYSKKSELRENCTGEGCLYDEVLLTDITKRIRSASKNKVLVILHTKGSHGPLYHERYPESFAQFKPVCKSVELNKCEQSELVNAYDNSILYTDHFITEAISRLKTLTDREVAMIYVSDHGESLGEYGLYLHGTPRALAPDVQIDVPFIVWMSTTFKDRRGLNRDSFTKPEYGHQNVFHSVLGILGISGDVYNPSLDIFRD